MYDGSRAVDCDALHDAFAGVVEEKVAKSLKSASMRGQLSAAKRFVAEEGADVNEQGSSGKTVLYYAAQRNHCDVLGFLLESRADVNLGSADSGASPLCVAAQLGFGEVVQQLLAANADVNQGRYATTPLSLAKKKGHTESSRCWLLQAQPPCTRI